jgi:hypothetical protein
MLSVNINIKHLQKEVAEREQKKIKTFEKILDTCYNKILQTNQKTNDCTCIFTCPPVVFGLPLYNLNDCVVFIMEKLIDKGFQVYFTNPNILFISWKTTTEQSYQPQLQLQQGPTRKLLTQNSSTSINPNNYYQSEDKKTNQRSSKGQYGNNINNINNINNTNNNYSTSSLEDIDMSFSRQRRPAEKQSFKSINDYTETKLYKNENSLDDLDIFKNSIEDIFD